MLLFERDEKDGRDGRDGRDSCERRVYIYQIVPVTDSRETERERERERPYFWSKKLERVSRVSRARVAEEPHASGLSERREFLNPGEACVLRARSRAQDSRQSGPVGTMTAFRELTRGDS